MVWQVTQTPQHEYLIDVSIHPTEVNQRDDVKITVKIINPEKESFDPYLKIEYNDDWRTNNYYINSDFRVPMSTLAPNQIKEYSVSFDSEFYKIESKTYTFNITLYDTESGNNVLDSRSLQVDVK